MMIEEFRNMQESKEKPISPEDYKLVEFVYNYYPLNFSKKAVVSLYDEFGMIIFLDLLPRAKKAAKIETDLRIVRQHYYNIQDEYNSLGEWGNEEYDLEI